MMGRQTTVLVMAAGTGGHVFPALAIANKLADLGARIEWLGTAHGLENKLLANSGIRIHQISAKGLMGTGILRKISAPFMLMTALLQSLRIIISVKPDCVLGMGGFVSGPGGMAAKILGKPLLIHEQNAIAGVTNRILSKIADKVFEAFPNTFPQNSRLQCTGNPVREEIATLYPRVASQAPHSSALRILVLGGSQGAAALNEAIPQLLLEWPHAERPQIWHQTGSRSLESVRINYQSLGLALTSTCRVEAFIDDMAAAYTWADLVICRSGASTVSELAVAGLPAILIPYPYHSDQQQLHNARWLTENGAAQLLMQQELSASRLVELVVELHNDRSRLQIMQDAATALAVVDASSTIAKACMEYAHA